MASGSFFAFVQKKTPWGSYQGNYCLEATDFHTFSKCSRSQSLSWCHHKPFTVLPCTMKHLLLAICCMPSLLLHSVPLKSTSTWMLLVLYCYFCFRGHLSPSCFWTVRIVSLLSLYLIYYYFCHLFLKKKKLKMNAQFYQPRIYLMVSYFLFV